MIKKARSRASVLSLGLLSACAAARYEQRSPPTQPYDAVIVPGCPSNPDGSLSLCQLSRALFAAEVYDRGQARHFIVSGSAVHNPYVEAEALAAGMAAVGVPEDLIYLERDALHTDENMYFSMRIARAKGLRTLAVVSSRGHAAWGCRMLADWGQGCTSISVDLDVVKRRHQRARPQLDGVRTAARSDWMPLVERERLLSRRTGRRRPPSFVLYPMMGLLRVQGRPWVPIALGPPQLTTWADR